MRASLLMVIGLFGLVTAPGCDTKAKASEPAASGIRAEQKSREYESCGASMHCADELRCFDHTCRRTARSTVGDYFAAFGATARARGDHAAAIAAYASALGHYDAEKLPLPAEIDCAYGGVLAAAKGNKEHAELGARVLHRCVLAAPIGSAIRDKAITELAGLADAGLDPLLLGAGKTADLYMTKGPAKRATEKLSVAVELVPMPVKTGPVITARLAEQDVKNALVGCWEQHHAATKGTTAAGSIAVTSRYVPAEYEDESGRYAWKDVPQPELPQTPAMTGWSCIRGVLETAVKALKPSETFNAKLTVTIK